MLEHLIGKRIKLLDMKNDLAFGKTLNRGDIGTVTDVNRVDLPPRPFTQIWVKFDSGSYIALLMGEDRFEIL